MPAKLNTILGLSPGTREMGYAVIIDGELVDWGLKSFKGKWTTKKESKIITVFGRLVSDYQATDIALKISRTAQSSQNLKHVYTLLKAVIKKKGLRLSTFSIEKLKQNCSHAKNKQEVLQFTKKYFPELNEDPATKKQAGNLRQFEAIAVALCAN